LRVWGGSDQDKVDAKALSARVAYTGNPAHKRNPGDFSLSPPAAPRQNATLCDEAGVFSKAEAISLLREGACRGLVDVRTIDGFPMLIWAIRESDDVVFEAELENSGLGQYHGYPMPLSDPFRLTVIGARRR
jgi:hypothetical protein